LKKYIFNIDNVLTGLISLSAVIFIFISKPFMKLPFDIWQHLMKIRAIYEDGYPYIFYSERLLSDQPHTKSAWHYMWALILKMLPIGTDVYLWAEIIHTTQFLISFWAIYFVSSKIFHAFIQDSKQDHRYIALASSIIWVLSTGTLSVGEQLPWIMWYSVTYQGLTMPIYFICTGILLDIFFFERKQRIKIAQIFTMIILLCIVMLLHIQEAAYILISSSFISLFFSKEIYKTVKQNITASAYVLIASSVILSSFTYVIFNEHWVTPITYKTSKNYDNIFDMISYLGHNVVVYYSRFPSTFNELAMAGLASGVLLTILTIFLKKYNRRFLISILLLSLFYFITPLTPTLAGIFAILGNVGVVYRFFYAPLSFVFMPILFFIIISLFTKKHISLMAFVLTITCVAGLVTFSAKYTNHYLYDNTSNIFNSLKTNFLQFNKEELQTYDELLNSYDVPEGKTPIYYVRADLAPVIRALKGKQVLQYTRFKKIPPYLPDELLNKYYIVIAGTPPNFKRDERLFALFPQLRGYVKVKTTAQEPFTSFKAITKDTMIMESFRSKDLISEIDLFIGERSKSSDKNIVITIKENDGKTRDIREIIVQSSDLKPNSWNTFVIDPVSTDINNKYYLCVHSTNGEKDDAIKIAISDGSNIYQKGLFYVDNIKVNGDMVFSLY